MFNASLELIPPCLILVGVAADCLKDPSFVDLLTVYFDYLDFLSSSFTSSSSRALANFRCMILKRSFFCALRPSFYMRRPLRRDFRCDEGSPWMKSEGSSIALISDSLEALAGGR